MTTFLRWIAVLPGAIIAGLLATFPLHWILYLAFALDGSTLFGFVEFENGLDITGIEYALSPFVIALFYMWAGTEIAPKHKFATALVLGVLYVCAEAYIFFGSGVQATFDFRTAGALFGVFLGLLFVWQKTRQIKHP